MKTLIFYVLFAAYVHSAELSFVVQDSSVPRNEYPVLLDAFDAFSQVLKTNTSSASVRVNVEKKVLTVRWSGQPSARQMSDALMEASIKQTAIRLDAEIEALRVRLTGIKTQLDRELDPQRRRILEQVYTSSLPPLDPPRQPYPLRIIKAPTISKS